MATLCVTPKRVAISGASSGNNTLVAAVSDASIRVLAMHLVADAAVTVTIKSASTSLSGAMSFAANGGEVLPHSPIGWYEGAKNEALIMTLGGAVQVSGSLVYELIPQA